MPRGPLIVVRIVPSFFHLAPRLSINGGDNYCDTGGGVRHVDIDAEARPSVTTAEMMRIKDSEHKVGEWRRAKKILKTASACFAQAERDRRLQS